MLFTTSLVSEQLLAFLADPHISVCDHAGNKFAVTSGAKRVPICRYLHASVYMQCDEIFLSFR